MFSRLMVRVSCVFNGFNYHGVFKSDRRKKEARAYVVLRFLVAMWREVHLFSSDIITKNLGC